MHESDVSERDAVADEVRAVALALGQGLELREHLGQSLGKVLGLVRVALGLGRLVALLDVDESLAHGVNVGSLRVAVTQQVEPAGKETLDRVRLRNQLAVNLQNLRTSRIAMSFDQR